MRHLWMWSFSIMLMGAFTEYLMAGVLAVSLLVAPPAARAEEPQVTCAPGITAERRHCPAILAQVDAMRAALTNAPPDYPIMYVMDHCIRGLSTSIPGYDYNTYMNSCGHIRLVLLGR